MQSKKKYIDADKLSEEIQNTYLDGEDSYSFTVNPEGDTLIGKFQVLDIISDQPAAEVEEIVRCKDCVYCKHWYRDKGICSLWAETGIDVFEDGFCSYGEKSESDKLKWLMPIPTTTKKSYTRICPYCGGTAYVLGATEYKFCPHCGKEVANGD